MRFSLFHSCALYFLVAKTSGCGFLESSSAHGCSCDESHGENLRCENITEERRLTNAYSEIEDTHFATFELLNSHLKAIPINPEVFKSASTIYIFQSSLDSLLLDSAPKNLDTLVLEYVSFRNGIKWDMFKTMGNLRYLIIRHVDIDIVDAAFGKNLNAELRAIMFSSTNTSVISDYAFYNFLHLEDLRIESAHVKKLKRNMFPNPAQRLEKLSFEDNKISFLPNDIFTEMPVLKNVDFSNNHIVEIPSSVFDIRKNLELFSLEGNPLDCSCSIRWFLFEDITWQESYGRQIEGLCSTPENLTGIEIHDLFQEDFPSCSP